MISDAFYGMGNYKVALEYCGKACKFIPLNCMSNENDIKPILYETIKITVDGLHMTSFPDYRTKLDIYDECKGKQNFVFSFVSIAVTLNFESFRRGLGLQCPHNGYKRNPRQADVELMMQIDAIRLHTHIHVYVCMHERQLCK